MHDSTARRLAARVGVAAATLARLATLARRLAPAAPALAMPAQAAAARAAAGPGEAGERALWLFVTVAFLVVAAACFAAGSWRARARQQGRDEAVRGGPAAPAVGSKPPSPGQEALFEPAGGSAREVWRTLVRARADDARPILLLESIPPGAPRRLAQANAAALRLLGLDAAACGQAWSSLEAAAPAALREALLEPALAGPWWVLCDAAGQSWLALGPDAAAQEDTAALVYTVSHDLRAPIRVVEGFTRIVKEDYGRQLDRVGNDHLDRVLAAGARMNQMIDAMLTMARLASQPLTRQPVDLSQIAGYVLDELARAAPERRVECVVAPGLRARGDPTLLRLVLENLLGNAWKYSARCAQARIAFEAVQQEGRRVFVVRDNGAGFDMRGAERLFGLFQRLHSAKDFAGTGVGLASVRRIVQRHGGQIWAEAEPGRGASFYFTLAE